MGICLEYGLTLPTTCNEAAFARNLLSRLMLLGTDRGKWKLFRKEVTQETLVLLEAFVHPDRPHSSLCAWSHFVCHCVLSLHTGVSPYICPEEHWLSGNIKEQLKPMRQVDASIPEIVLVPHATSSNPLSLE